MFTPRSVTKTIGLGVLPLLAGLPQTAWGQSLTKCNPGATVKVLFVTEDGVETEDGSYWNKAKDLQGALDAAALCLLDPQTCSAVEIWVKHGEYMPTAEAVPGEARSATFKLIDKVHLYGGFAGNEDSCISHFPATCSGDFIGKPCAETSDCPGGSCLRESTNVTLLSGDIGIPDVDTDNAYHVVTYDTPDATVKLEGFVIEKGYADGPGTNNQGAALQIRAPSVKYCYGGDNDGDVCQIGADCPNLGPNDPGCQPAICLSGGPTVRRCLFRGNVAANHGAVNDHGSISSFYNCVFRDNVAARGGGLLVDNGSPSVTYCVFIGNDTADPTGIPQTPHEGGGAWFGCRSAYAQCGSDCSPTITSTEFHNNTANKVANEDAKGFGGGAWAGSGTTPTFQDCLFKGNAAGNNTFTPSSAGFGGALFTTGSTPTINSSLFESNAADGSTLDAGAGLGGGGGGVWIQNTPSAQQATITDCVFRENTSDGFFYAAGGGLYQLNGRLRVESSRFEGNRAVESGGGAVQVGSAEATYVNNVFVGNWTTNQGQAGSGSAYAAYANVSTARIDFVNTSFVSNHHEHDAAALAILPSGGWAPTATATNCIFLGNTAGAGPAENTQVVLGILVTYSYIYGLINGTGQSFDDCLPICSGGQHQPCPNGDSDCTVGTCEARSCSAPSNVCCNIGAAPMALELEREPSGCTANGCTDYGDQRVVCGSPTTDAGSNWGAGPLPYDLLGFVRRYNDPHNDDVGDTGEGTAPIVDMGAYEYGSCFSTSDCNEVYPCVESLCMVATHECLGIAEGAGACTDCPSGQSGLCCNSSSCTVGTCCDHADCGSGEVCCDNDCVVAACCDNFDCPWFEQCCDGQCIDESACCPECSFGMVCCSGQCKISCKGGGLE